MNMLYESEDLRIDQRPDGSALLRIDVPGKSVNLISPALLQHLDEAFDALSKAQGIRVVVLRGDKLSGFLAGADLRALSKVKTPEDAYQLSALGQRVFSKLQALPLPTVALIHGPCLGGGLELALACDYRLALDHPKTVFGLPEVELGLAPDWGGTQRLPRVVGIEPALKLILGGQRWNAQQARRWGLIEDCAPTEGRLSALLSAWLQKAKVKGKRLWPRLPARTLKQLMVESNSLGRLLLFRGARRILTRKLPDDMPAPFEALEAVQTGLSKGLEAGFARERETARNLVQTPACRNLVNLFLQREAARKLPAEEERIDSQIQKIAVHGLGPSGAALACEALLKGLQVLVTDKSEAALAQGIVSIEGLLESNLRKRQLKETAQQKLAKLQGALELEQLKEYELVFLAEILSPDARTFAEHAERVRDQLSVIERFASPNSILAVQEHYALLPQLQAAMQHPGRLAGMRIFPERGVVELSAGEETEVETMFRLRLLANKLGKIPIVVRPTPGGLVGRLAATYAVETTQIAKEAKNQKLLTLALERFGMPHQRNELLKSFDSSVTEKLVEPMLRDARTHAPSSPLPAPMVENQPQTQLSQLPAAVQQTQARERVVLAMVNEAARCLEEGIAKTPEEIDLAAVLGELWPPHRGGPLRYAKDRGIANVMQSLKELESRYGARFAPSPGLALLAESESHSK